MFKPITGIALGAGSPVEKGKSSSLSLCSYFRIFTWNNRESKFLQEIRNHEENRSFSQRFSRTPSFS